jgi:hypothetical protein
MNSEKNKTIKETMEPLLTEITNSIYKISLGLSNINCIKSYDELSYLSNNMDKKDKPLQTSPLTNTDMMSWKINLPFAPVKNPVKYNQYQPWEFASQVDKIKEPEKPHKSNDNVEKSNDNVEKSNDNVEIRYTNGYYHIDKSFSIN